MRTPDVVPMHKAESAPDRRSFTRWLKAGAVIGVLLALTLLAVALVGPDPVRAGYALTSGAPAGMSAADKRPARSGTLRGYEIVF